MADLKDQKKDVEFNASVEDDSKYELKVSIGFEQPGSIRNFGGIDVKPEPSKTSSKWKTKIGKGKNLKTKTLEIYISTKDENPKFSKLGFVIALKNKSTKKTEQLIPSKGISILENTSKNQTAIFNVKLNFS